MRKLWTSIISISFIVFFSVVHVAHAEKVAIVDNVPSGYRTCAQLNAKYPTGVAKSLVAARRQGIRPKVSAVIYASNKALDRDGDGTICEVLKSKSSTNQPSSGQPILNLPATPANPTTTQYQCPTGTYSFKMTGIRTTLSFPVVSYPGVTYYTMEMVGTFVNKTNAVLFPSSMFAKVAFSPNTNDWLNPYVTSPTNASVHLNEGLSVQPGATAQVSGSISIQSTSQPTLTGQGSTVSWDDPKSVAWCSAPIAG